MSGSATIAITVGIAVAVLVGFFIVYYLGNVANSVYDIKVGVRKDFDKKVKELQEQVEKDTKQRINWMRDENKGEAEKLQVTIQDSLEEKYTELEKSVERLRADLTSLQADMASGALAGKAPKKSNVSADNPYRKQTTAESAGPGGLDLPRVGVPESDVAPDMAATEKKPAPRPERKAKSEALEEPKETAEKSPLAGKESVKQKARKVRKPKNKDEFESFGVFSDDFKAGG